MKKYIKIVIVLLVVLILTGCGDKKTALNQKQITDKLYKLEFFVDDNTKLMEDSTTRTALSAYNSKYQIEYYIFKDEKRAKEAFQDNKKYFDNNGKKGKEKTKENYSKYVQELSDTYNVLTRVDNTLLYISSNIEYKSDIKKVLKELNY